MMTPESLKEFYLERAYKTCRKSRGGHLRRLCMYLAGETTHTLTSLTLAEYDEDR